MKLEELINKIQKINKLNKELDLYDKYFLVLSDSIKNIYIDNKKDIKQLKDYIVTVKEQILNNDYTKKERFLYITYVEYDIAGTHYKDKITVQIGIERRQ